MAAAAVERGREAGLGSGRADGADAGIVGRLPETGLHIRFDLDGMGLEATELHRSPEGLQHVDGLARLSPAGTRRRTLPGFVETPRGLRQRWRGSPGQIWRWQDVLTLCLPRWRGGGRGSGSRPAQPSGKIATARVKPAEPPLILKGKHATSKPVGGSCSRWASFSMWQ